MDYHYNYNGKDYTVSVTKEGEDYIISSGSTQHKVSAEKMKKNYYSMILDGDNFKAVVSRKKELYHVFINGKIYQLAKTAGKRKKGDDSPGNLLSPITGKVVKVMVVEGDTVEKGQEIMILEAMKMEYTIKAPQDGSISKVSYKVDDGVQIGDELGIIKPAEKAEEKKEE